MRWESKRVTYATVQVVGSANDLRPWTDLPGGDHPDLRLAEHEARLAAALSWINDTFDRAERRNAAGVWLMLQAEPTASPGFSEIRAAIVERATAFAWPVILAHGDEHVYEVEPSYADVPNLTRLEAPGAVADQWLRVTVDPMSPACSPGPSRQSDGRRHRRPTPPLTAPTHEAGHAPLPRKRKPLRHADADEGRAGPRAARRTSGWPIPTGAGTLGADGASRRLRRKRAAPLSTCCRW